MLKLPKDFKLKVTMKKAVANAASVLIILKLAGFDDPILLGAGFVLGLVGGSVNDVWGFMENKKAITAYIEKENGDT